MLQNAVVFNQNISSWNTSKVTNMSYMFYNAPAFNQNIGSWNTSKATIMSNMFQNATIFNQNISSWNVNRVTKPPTDFSTGSALTNSPTYIPYWYLSLEANGVTVKSTLSSLPSSPIPLFIRANLRGTLEWFAVVNDSSKALITSYANPLAGPDVISYFTPSGQTPAVTTPVPFNNIVTTFMTDMSSLFENASSFNSDISSWHTSKVTTMNSMFNGATIFNQNISYWDVYNLSTKPQQPTDFSTGSAIALPNNTTNMPYWSGIGLDANGVTIKTTILSLPSSPIPLFIRANLRGTLEWFAVVNQSSKTNITNYAKGINTGGSGSSKFIPPLDSSVVPFNNIVTTCMTDMSSLFTSATTFNQNIGSWDTSRVTIMESMFQNATIFNQNIGSWDTSKVTNMNKMFQNATIFYQNISGWIVTSVTTKPPTSFSTGSALNNNNAYKPVGFY
jgi:surface protein